MSRKRAPRGSIVRRKLVPLTAEASDALQALAATWECDETEALRRALLAAVLSTRTLVTMGPRGAPLPPDAD